MTARAAAVDVENAEFPGKSGQVAGVAKIGLPPDADWELSALTRMDMPQWCAPCRRQQAGNPDWSSAWRVAATGPKPKNEIRKIESQRLIWNKWYTSTQ